MSLFDIFKRRGSAPVARERLQVLLAYERTSRNKPDLVLMLQEEIMAVIARHVQIDQDDVHVSIDRGNNVSTLEIDIQLRSPEAAAQLEERFCAPAEEISTPGSAPTGVKERARSTAFAALSPLL